MNNAYSSRAGPRGKKTQAELFISDLLFFLVKVALIVTMVTLLFTFLFGVFRNISPGMNPSIRDGDLVFYYRLDKNYHSGDVLVASYEGKDIALRVVAIAGEKVDIRNGGLYVNGSLQAEANVYTGTEQYAEGVEFPLTVPHGCVFALGDHRTDAIDCRIFGPVSVSNTKGKVMALLRRRGI